MASAKDLILRCKTEKGSFLLKYVNSDTTVRELKTYVSDVLYLMPERIKILCGFPPQPLAEGIDNLTLNDVNIQSGETIIIEKYPKKLEDGSNFRDKPSNAVGDSSCVTVINPMISANKDFIIRCKTEKGSFVMKHLNSESTVGELKMSLCQVMDINHENFKILRGYPPRELADDSDDLTLKNVNIQSGDTIILGNDRKKLGDGSSFQDISFGCSTKVIGGGATDIANPSNELDNFPGGTMMRHAVPGNGSCLFSSVFFILTNGSLHSEEIYTLRRLIARVVSENHEKYNSAFLGMSNEDYCSWIQNSSNWGGAIELSILSEHFNVEIVVVDTRNLNIHRFGENANYSNRFFLLYDGTHYDPLVLKYITGNLQTSFPVSDDRVMEMALKIASKPGRQCTNTTDTLIPPVHTYTLICMTCEAKIQSDMEARAHTLFTNHEEFDKIA